MLRAPRRQASGSGDPPPHPGGGSPGPHKLHRSTEALYEKIGIAIIGTGTICHRHLKVRPRIPGAKIAAADEITAPSKSGAIRRRETPRGVFDCESTF